MRSFRGIGRNGSPLPFILSRYAANKRRLGEGSWAGKSVRLSCQPAAAPELFQKSTLPLFWMQSGYAVSTPWLFRWEGQPILKELPGDDMEELTGAVPGPRAQARVHAARRFSVSNALTAGNAANSLRTASPR